MESVLIKNYHYIQVLEEIYCLEEKSRYYKCSLIKAFEF